MKGKQLVIVLVLLAALGGVALLLRSRNSSSWSNTATTTEGKVLSFSLNDVSHVTIKGNDAALNLEKKDDVWKVRERADYPADFDKVAGLIRKLWELRPAQDVTVGASQLGRLQLTEPGKETNSGTLVDLRGNEDKRLAALLLGKKNLRETDQSSAQGGGIPAGRYVMGLDSAHRAFLVSEVFDEAQTKPESWLSHDFIKVENPRSIAVAGASGGPINWKATRESNSAPWKVLDAKQGEEIDNAKISNLTAILASATFADVLDPKTPPAETGLAKPSTARIETFDNFVYELRIGKLMSDNYPILVAVSADFPKDRVPGRDEKPEDKATLDQQFQAKQKELTDKLAREKKLENWPYLIAKGTVEQLLIARSALFAEKKATPSPTATSSSAGAKGASPATAPGKINLPSPSPPGRPRPK